MPPEPEALDEDALLGAMRDRGGAHDAANPYGPQGHGAGEPYSGGNMWNAGPSGGGAAEMGPGMGAGMGAAPGGPPKSPKFDDEELREMMTSRLSHTESNSRAYQEEQAARSTKAKNPFQGGGY